jgi:uncharacterized protein YndB with AHSA1/START domain
MVMSTNTPKHDLVVTRTFDAPIEQVWQSWTDGAILQKWWGPEGFTCPLAQMDVREEGTSLVAMHSPDHGTHYSTWHYQQIVPNERLAFIHNLADEHGNKIDPAAIGMPPDFPKDQPQTVTFRALADGKTELTVVEYGWMPGQMMELSRLGMTQCLDKLEALLANK